MTTRDLTKVKQHLFICNGDHCTLHGAAESTKAIRKIIKEMGLDDEVHTTKTYCNGRCLDGPIVIAEPGYVWYKSMTQDKAKELVHEHILSDRILSSNLLHIGIKDVDLGSTQN